MADEHCRITVVAERRQVDLAVPAHVPITDWIDGVAGLCGADDDELMPVAWSLRAGPAVPLPPDRSLAESGVTDGEVLHLTDLLADEYDEPVVRDVAEQVTEVSERLLDRRWDTRSRAVVVLLSGLVWLSAGVLLGRTVNGGTDGAELVSWTALGVCGLLLGVLLPVLGWVAGERRWAVPVGVRTALAVCAVPAFAMAGLGLTAGAAPGGSGITGGAVAAVTCGALIGAVLACAAALNAVTAAVLLVVFTATVPTVVLALTGTGLDRSAAVAGLLAFALLLVAPGTAGRVAATGYRHSGRELPASGPALEAAVRNAMRLLLVWSGLLSLTLAVSLALLAGTASPYGPAIAAALALGLLLRAGQAVTVSEVAPVGAAGAVGVFFLLLNAPERFGLPPVAGLAGVMAVAVVLVAYGFRRLMRPESAGAGRPGWLGNAGTVVGALAIPLTVAAFGVFDMLSGLGSHL
ncbi:EsaB/YukD family protein [Streptomyces sp. NPDC019224]|uniref:EsaB/YukD family protein n=1 Tax=Streptomyces sp. NPDC019224 TaxID=3154484 RepID=UPI0033C8FA76